MRNLLDVQRGLSLAQLVHEGFADMADAYDCLRAAHLDSWAARVAACGTESALALEAVRRELEPS